MGLAQRGRDRRARRDSLRISPATSVTCIDRVSEGRRASGFASDSSGSNSDGSNGLPILPGRRVDRSISCPITFEFAVVRSRNGRSLTDDGAVALVEACRVSRSRTFVIVRSSFSCSTLACEQRSRVARLGDGPVRPPNVVVTIEGKGRVVRIGASVRRGAQGARGVVWDARPRKKAVRANLDANRAPYRAGRGACRSSRDVLSYPASDFGDDDLLDRS